MTVSNSGGHSGFEEIFIEPTVTISHIKFWSLEQFLITVSVLPAVIGNIDRRFEPHDLISFQLILGYLSAFDLL